MSSVEETTLTMKGLILEIREDVVEVKEEIMSPLVQVMSIVQGVRKGLDLVNAFFKKEEGGKNA